MDVLRNIKKTITTFLDTGKESLSKRSVHFHFTEAFITLNIQASLTIHGSMDKMLYT